MTPLSRRSFLASTTAAGALAATGPLILGADEAPSKVVTIGVMGMSRGRSLAQTFGSLPGVRIKYVCDVDPVRVEQGKAEVEKLESKQAPQAVLDFRKILDDPEVDALVCAAPNHWHAPAAIMACQAGKHCYVEKPCCHNPWEGELLIAMARKYNKAVQMGNQRRSGPGFIEAMKRLQEGVIGRVYLSKSWYTALRPTIGKGEPAKPPEGIDYSMWQGPAPHKEFRSNYLHYNWHWFWHWGNGELGNNGIHAIDISRWGLGADYPIRVTSSGGRYRFQDDQETPDTHTICVEFDGGRQAIWEGRSCNKHDAPFVEFYGEDGTMRIDENGKYTIYNANDKEIEVVAHSRNDAQHVGNFLAAIRNNTPLALNSEIEEGYKSTLLCHLGNIAQRTGRTLQCDSKNGHILNDEEAMAFWKREYAKEWTPKES